MSAGSRAISPPPFSRMEQAECSVEMEGEVEFKRDTKSNLMKAVSGTEWMYRRGALERGRQVSVCVCVCVCLHVGVGVGWVSVWGDGYVGGAFGVLHGEHVVCTVCNTSLS